MGETTLTTTYHLRILAEASKTEAPRWEVAVYLGGACFAKNITLSDPFTKAEEDECRWYLEDYLTKSPFEKGRAELAVESLNSYADSLFEQLHLSRVWRRLSGKTNHSNKVLEIDIVEDIKDSNSVLSDTIHRLHWEVLEWPRLWKNIKLRTTVRRVIPQNDASNLSISRVESWSQGVPAVNVLLVISRKLVNQGADEVDPNLALQSLQTLKRDLETRGAPFRLNIEIVRPGSFKALKKHLEGRSELQHSGDVHIVHFDVHGRVGLRSEKGEDKVTTAAFLYFQSGKGDGRLSPTRAGAVAQLLRKHNIRIAVLNACESAKANKGDEANLARVFTKAGVQNVLAMAYRTLGSTSTEFMRAFYESLIAGGEPFSTAVRVAREYLRASPIRDARFALKRSLEDWIVPVVYASGKDVELHISTASDIVPALEVLTLTTTSKDQPSTALELFGRGFDVLRFETMFLASKLIGLSGPAGVGKTEFIHHLLRCWEDTGLFEKTLHVDCSSVDASGADTPAALLRQLLCGEQDRWKSGQFAGDEKAYQSNLSELGSYFQVIVFDNLEASHSDFNEMDEHGRWPGSARTAFTALIRDIIRNSSEDEEGPSLILVGRRDDDDWWERQLPELLEFPRYRLKSLSHSDAIELSYNFLKDLGFDRSRWDNEDENILSQVLNILQCNPLAIDIVLRTVVSRNHSWKELLNQILFHQFTGAWPLHKYGCRFPTRDMEFGSNSGPLSLYHANVYCNLALYWHEGPQKDVFKEWLEASPEEHGCQAIEFGVDRGYFSLNAEGRIERIHPLFTLLGRSIFPLVPGILAVGLVWTMAADEDTVPDQFVGWFVALFFKGMISRRINETLRPRVVDGKFTEIEKDARPVFYNILTSLRLCSMGKELIFPTLWPEDTIIYVTLGMYFLSVDEMALLVKHYEHFLRRFISRRTTTEDSQTLFLMISIGNSLATAHWTLSTLDVKRALDFSQLTFDIIDKTDAVVLEEPGLTGVVSFAMMNRGFADFAQGTKTVAECRASGNSIPDLMFHRVQDDEQRSLIDSLTWNDIPNPNHIPNLQQLAPQMENIFENRDMKARVSEIQESVARGTGAVDLMDTVLGGTTIRPKQQEFFEGWANLWIQAIQHDSNVRSLDLEKALDVRNRLDAITHYKALAAQALEEQNVELLIELLNSMIEIFQSDEVFAEDLAQALKVKKGFEGFIRVMQLCTSGPGTRKSSAEIQAILDHVETMEFLESQREYHDSMREHIRKVVKRKLLEGESGEAVKQPKKRLNDVMKEVMGYAVTSEGQAKLLEIGVPLRARIKQHEQAIEVEDFETAITTLDQIVEDDDPTIFAEFSLKDMDQERQRLVSSRDFKKALVPLIQAMQENRLQDAISLAESLLQDYEGGKYPNVMDHLILNTRYSLERSVWLQTAQKWELAFIADEYPNAFTELRTLRRLEVSKAFDEPITTQILATKQLLTFDARTVTEWDYLRLLHRHFGETKRPRLALKTVIALLERYDHPEDLVPPAWLLPGVIEDEHGFKWLYEIEVEIEKYTKCLVVDRDATSAAKHLEVVQRLMTQNVPEAIPQKEFKRVNFAEIRAALHGL